MSDQHWIQIIDAEKSIGDFQLGPVNIEFEAGMITVIAGDNGAGKSTLLRLLMDLARLDAGCIEIFEEDLRIADESWKQKVAFLPQSCYGWNSFKGSELAQLFAALYPSWEESFFKRMASELNIPLNKAFGKLSQGVQQKLALALALARDTDILILDEPTAHIDIPSKHLLMNFMIEWMERGERLLIISSHQMDDIRKLADYIVIMRDGKILGNYVKEELASVYKRYWLDQEIGSEQIPGEVDRKDGRIIVTNQADEAETYFDRHGLRYTNTEILDLEEVITFMLTK